MAGKEQLDAAIAAAVAGGDAAALDRLAACDLGRLPPLTALGINRRLHAAMLRLAKRRGDQVARAGLQAHLVPPPGVLARFSDAAAADRRASVQAHGQPVPRVIHQVWIGPRPVPPTLSAWADHAAQRSCAHRIWREEDLAREGFDAHPTFRQRLARGDYPGAVDAARYAILARYGGIYLDADWYPARMDAGFHDLLPMAGLVAMAEPLPRLTAQGAFLLANSMIAAPPGHPAMITLCRILPEVEATLPGAPAWWTTGPLIFTLIARAGALCLADAGLVAASMPGTATEDDIRARASEAEARNQGLLIAWKPW